MHPRRALWTGALAVHAGGPYFFGLDGWQLVPGHFAERHGLIIIIALGESVGPRPPVGPSDRPRFAAHASRHPSSPPACCDSRTENGVTADSSCWSTRS